VGVKSDQGIRLANSLQSLSRLHKKVEIFDISQSSTAYYGESFTSTFLIGSLNIIIRGAIKPCKRKCLSLSPRQFYEIIIARLVPSRCVTSCLSNINLIYVYYFPVLSMNFCYELRHRGFSLPNFGFFSGVA
jgi:hypothetical protein